MKEYIIMSGSGVYFPSGSFLNENLPTQHPFSEASYAPANPCALQSRGGQKEVSEVGLRDSLL